MKQCRTPQRRRAKQCRRDALQSAARLPSLARYGVRAVDTGNNSQGLVAQPRTPHLHCAARAALQAANCQCKFSLGGSKGGVSLFKKEIPLPCSCSAGGAASPPPLPRGEQTKRKPSQASFSQVWSLHRDRLRKIARFVNITPALERNIVREQLQRHHTERR